MSYVDRPIPMSETEFKKKKDLLSTKVNMLLKQGRNLHKQQEQLEAKISENKFGSFSLESIKAKRNAKQQEKEFEAHCMLAEEEFDKLNQISQYSSKVEPMKYQCNLILGVVLTVLFIIFFIHMFAAGSVM